MKSSFVPAQAVFRWRGLAVYLALAFGLSWAVQIGPALALHRVPGGILPLGGGALVVAVFLMWPPAIGEYVARRWVEGGDFTDAGLRRPWWRFVALAWLGQSTFTAQVSLPLYPFDPTFVTLRELAERAGQALPAPSGTIVLVQLLSGLTLAVPINALFTFGEEFGWRGYLLPRLIQAFGPWPGLLAHGAIGGCWHAPLILLTGYNNPGHPVLGVPLFVMSGALIGVLLGWLQLASRCVVPPTIAHASLNAISGAPLLVLRGVDPAVADVVSSPAGRSCCLPSSCSGRLERSACRWRLPPQQPRSPACNVDSPGSGCLYSGRRHPARRLDR